MTPSLAPSFFFKDRLMEAETKQENKKKHSIILSLMVHDQERPTAHRKGHYMATSRGDLIGIPLTTLSYGCSFPTFFYYSFNQRTTSAPWWALYTRHSLSNSWKAPGTWRVEESYQLEPTNLTPWRWLINGHGQIPYLIGLGEVKWSTICFC